MGRKRLKLSKTLLRYLYYRRGLSPYKIAPLVGVNFGTVRNRLKEYGIMLRTKAAALMKYQKRNFSGDTIEAAYLLGFRLGDLNVYVPKAKHSETVVARCHTTDMIQVQLMEKLFKKYGHVQISTGGYGFHVNCLLNNTFQFLVPKNGNITQSIENNSECAAAFFAGYVDAEGNFIINQGRGRFKVDSYDYEILAWAHQWLSFSGIRAKFRKIASSGIAWKSRIVLNKDLWRLNINEAHSLKKFIRLSLPYLQHRKRRKNAKLVLRNIEKRIHYGTI